MDPFTIAAGVGGALSGISGMGASSAQRGLMKTQKQMLDEQRKRQLQYLDPALAQMSEVYKNPQRDPWYQAQMRGAESDVKGYMDQGLGALTAGYAGRGESSFREGDYGGVVSTGLGQLAKTRTAQIGDQWNRKLQALQMMMGLVSGSQGPDYMPLANAYGDLSNQGINSVIGAAGAWGQRAGQRQPQTDYWTGVESADPGGITINPAPGPTPRPAPDDREWYR